jgi:multimeric flavodoxin WrbA
VKNVFDRSISYVLPFFEIINGEMHHKSRYPEQKPITFIFRGNGLSDNDKKLARSYVKAVCTNLHGIIKDIKFEEYDPELTGEMEQKKSIDNAAEEAKETILLNCSLRADAANSKKMLDALSSKITGDKESVNLSSFINNMDELVTRLKGAEKIVFGTPLYVDGIPSALLRLLCKMEQNPGSKNKIIYTVTNMGFYESSQQKHLVAMIKRWCSKCCYKYGGAVAVGAGEMVGMMVNTSAAEKGPAKNAAQALQSMGEAVNSSSSMENIYANAAMFPRFMYMFAANSGWPRSGKQNGLKKKVLFKQIDLS